MPLTPSYPMSALLGNPVGFTLRLHWDLQSLMTSSSAKAPYLLDSLLKETLDWLLHSAVSLTDHTEQPMKSLYNMTDHAPQTSLPMPPPFSQGPESSLPTRLWATCFPPLPLHHPLSYWVTFPLHLFSLYVLAPGIQNSSPLTTLLFHVPILQSTSIRLVRLSCLSDFKLNSLSLDSYSLSQNIV